MKSIITAAAFVFLTTLLVGTASFDVRADGQMRGGGLVKVPVCLQLAPALAHAAADPEKFFLQR
jgi:hypothetical protein